MPAKTTSYDLPLDDYTLRVRRIASDDPTAAHKPTLVFLHDSLGCITVWRDFPDVLSAALGCNALIYDRRGYGASSPFGGEPRRPAYLEDEADTLLRVLQASAIDHAILFGHSDGGSIALVAAARYPDRIGAVVTQGAHVFVEEVTLAGIREARETLRTTDLRERLARHHGDRTDSVTAAWIDMWLSPEFRDWNIEHYLPNIRCPLLAIQGSDDEYGTPDQVRAVVEGSGAGARACMIPGVGHTPHRSATDEVVRATKEFLRENLPEFRT